MTITQPMKKLFTLLVLLTVALGLNAQNSWQGGVRMGIGNNFLLSKNAFSGASDSTGKWSPDYSVGVSVGWFHNKRTYYSHKLKGLRLEAHYTSLNQTYKGEMVNGETKTPFTTKLRAGYMSVPLLFCVNPSSDHGFFFETGPQFSFLIHAKESFTTDGRNAEMDFSRTNKTGLAPINYQFAMNFGKIWNVGYNGAIHVGVKLTYTFNQVVTDRATGPYQNFGAMLYTGFTLRGRDHYN